MGRGGDRLDPTAAIQRSHFSSMHGFRNARSVIGSITWQEERDHASDRRPTQPVHRSTTYPLREEHARSAQSAMRGERTAIQA
jgi:hypothetical protein